VARRVLFDWSVLKLKLLNIDCNTCAQQMLPKMHQWWQSGCYPHSSYHISTLGLKFLLKFLSMSFNSGYIMLQHQNTMILCQKHNWPSPYCDEVSWLVLNYCWCFVHVSNNGQICLQKFLSSWLPSMAAAAKLMTKSPEEHLCPSCHKNQ